MTTNEAFRHNAGSGQNPQSGSGKTIDLQGVAAFVGLVELIAQELGTAPGRIQGHLPNGPAAFEELIGEIQLNSQGFLRSLAFLVQPGSPLTLRFQSAWRAEQRAKPDGAPLSGVEAHFFLDGTVEQIAPQGRALARYIEDTFKVLDSMVTLGQSGKLSAMSVSTSEIEAFESAQSGNLVQTSLPKRAENFGP